MNKYTPQTDDLPQDAKTDLVLAAASTAMSLVALIVLVVG